MKHRFGSILTVLAFTATALCSAALVSCKGGNGDTAGSSKGFTYNEGFNEEGLYDSSLFYRNDFGAIPAAPDPFILYDEGWYYLYSTEISPGVLAAYRTQNFATWEYLGEVFHRSSSYWGVGCFWAPKAVKNPADGKIYMYTCCNSGSNAIGYPEGVTSSTKGFSSNKDGLWLTVLVADSPAGPFREWTGERPEHAEYRHGEPTGVVGDEVTLTSGPMFDFAQAPDAWESNKGYYAKNGTNIFGQLDAFPFFDDNGDFYLYFIRSRDLNDETGKQGAWGVKMIDMVTPDYSTLTCLTRPGYVSPGGERSGYTVPDDITVNEGVCVQSHVTKKPDGTEVKKYYLTYSRYGYGNPNYSACLAMADSPLGYEKGSEEAPGGGFVKLPTKYGNPVHMIGQDYDMYNATGNAMFFKAEGEEFLVSLATVNNRTTPDVTERNFIIDRVSWEYNEELGYDIVHSNGPTQASLQPAPYSYTGFRNIAAEAKVTATNGMKGEEASELTDEYVAIHGRDAARDFVTKEGGTTITLDFGKYRSLRAVMVYNTSDMDYAFSKLDSVTLRTDHGTFTAADVLFPEEYLTGSYDLGGSIRPGGAAVISFPETNVDRVTIKISAKYSDFGEVFEEYGGVAVSEVRVLGRPDGESGTSEASYTGTGLEGIDNPLDMLGYGALQTAFTFDEDGVKITEKKYAPLRASNAAEGFYAEYTVRRSDGEYILTEAANTGAFTVTAEGVRYRLYLVGVDGETSKLVISGVEKQTSGSDYNYYMRSYSVPVGGYLTGSPVKLGVAYLDGAYFVTIEAEGKEPAFVRIAEDTPFEADSSLPSDFDAFFGEEERVLGLEALDYAATFSDVSFALGNEAARAHSDADLRTVSVQNGEGGTVTAETSVRRGENVTVTLKADDGRYLDTFTVNGRSMKHRLENGENGTIVYTIVCIQTDVIIRVSWGEGTEPTYLVTGTYSYSSGEMAANGTVGNEGDRVTVSAGIYTGTAENGEFGIYLPKGRFDIELKSELFPAASATVTVGTSAKDAGNISFDRLYFDPAVAYNADGSVTFSTQRMTKMIQNAEAEDAFVVNYTVAGGVNPGGWFNTGGVYLEYLGKDSKGLDIVYYDYILFFTTGGKAQAVFLQSKTKWNNGPTYQTTHPYASLRDELSVTVAYLDETFYFILDDCYAFSVNASTALGMQQNENFDKPEFFRAKTRSIGLRSYDSTATFSNVSYQLGRTAAERVKEQINASLSYTAGGGGTLTLHDAGAKIPSGATYPLGKVFTAEVVPDEGKAVTSFTVNGEDAKYLLEGPFVRNGKKVYRYTAALLRGGMRYEAEFGTTDKTYAVTGSYSGGAANVLVGGVKVGTGADGKFSVNLADGTYIITLEAEGKYGTKQVVVHGGAADVGAFTLTGFGLQGAEATEGTYSLTAKGSYPFEGDIVAADGFALSYTLKGYDVNPDNFFFHTASLYWEKDGVMMTIVIRSRGGKASVCLMQSGVGSNAYGSAMIGIPDSSYSATDTVEVKIAYYHDAFYISFGGKTVRIDIETNADYSDQRNADFFNAGFRKLGFRVIDSGSDISGASYVLGDEKALEAVRAMGFEIE